MYVRTILFSTITAMLSACNTVNVPIENAESVTITNNNPSRVTTTVSKPSSKPLRQPDKSFKYLSKLTLKKGPCPDRDPSSYGVLMKQRTTIIDGNIICYYN
jgi:hypothetical protein